MVCTCFVASVAKGAPSLPPANALAVTLASSTGSTGPAGGAVFVVNTVTGAKHQILPAPRNAPITTLS